MRGTRLSRLFVRYRSKSDVESLAAVFDEVGPGLLQVARHLSARGCEPEDLVQSTFLTAIERAETYDAKRPLVPWLMGILVNQARLARRKRIPLFDDNLWEVSVEGTSEVDLDSRELAVAVVSALREVPEKYREVLIPHLGEGLKPHEIATLLGRPQGTVRAQIHRGLKMIRRLLPTGFAAGTALMVSSRESLAGVREVVLLEARRASASSGRTSATTTGAGPRVLLRPMIAACTLLAVGVAVWLALPDDRTAVLGSARRLADSEARTEIAMLRVPEGPPAANRARAAEETRALDPVAELFGALEIVVLRAQDRAPASGVAVTVIAWGDERWFEHVIAAPTDAEGRAHFPRLHAGPVGVHADRGEQHRTKVEAGTNVAYEIVLPAGIDLRGFVTDRAGLAVEGADVELLADTAGSEVRSSTRTGADGAFLLRSVDREGFVRAHTPGRAPSDLYWLGGSDFATSLDFDLQLVLDDAAPPLAGRVLDSNGRPVAGARVAVARAKRVGPRACETGLFALDPPPARASSDEDGRFAIDELTPGALEIAVQSEGRVPFHATLRRDASDETGVVLRLAAGAFVRGLIETQAGRPAVGALVRARTPGSTEWIETRTDDGGRFALQHVPAGEIELEARERGFAAASSAVVQLAEGEELRWNRVIPAAKTISGLAIGQDGRPSRTWLVKATPIRSISPADVGLGTRLAAYVTSRSTADLVQCWTDSRGGFRVPCSEDGPHRLELRPRMAWKGPVVAVVPEVDAGAQDVELRAPWRSARVHGSLVGADGEPVAGARAIVLAVGQQHGIAGFGLADSGRFETTLLIPGEYEIVVYVPGRGLERVGKFTVSQLEELDLGLRRLAPTGGIRVPVELHARSVRAHLVDLDGQLYDVARLPAGALQRAGLRAGRYRLVTEIDGAASEREIEVVAGEVRAIE